MKQSERVINRFLTWFDPILLTDWDEAIWIRILENSRLFGFNGKPVGGEPDEIVNDTCSPTTEAVIENTSFFMRNMLIEEVRRMKRVNERTTVSLTIPFTASMMLN